MTDKEIVIQHKDFWVSMYGEEKWIEIKKNLKSSKIPEARKELDDLYDEYEKNEFTMISIFDNVEDTKPKDFSLEAWLFQTKKPMDDVKSDIESYRDTFDQELKKKLPCCTISASFSDYRNLENIKKKNRLICIDIDRHTKSKRKKSNVCVDMQLVKELFIQHPSTLYVGFSCSNDGVYAILRIYDAERLDDYFNHFQEKFARIGLNIDESCKDYTRLRFFSIDEESYFNPNAKFYKLPEVEKKTEKKTTNKTQNQQDNQSKIEKICDVVESNQIDITSSYDDWIAIGAALYDEFGDNGIEYFHRLSKFHADYSLKSCEKKFNQCKKMKNFKINSLLYIASSYGVKYKS